MTTAADPAVYPAGLTDTERRALDVCHAAYLAVRQSPALDDMAHWERFANRLKSAAYAQTGSAFLEQLARRFGVPHTPGGPLVALLDMPARDARDVLRTIRRESNALSVLVRERRDTERTERGTR